MGILHRIFVETAAEEARRKDELIYDEDKDEWIEVEQ